MARNNLKLAPPHLMKIGRHTPRPPNENKKNEKDRLMMHPQSDVINLVLK